ncbi:phytoene dehydrogenase [Tabrizicola sp. TH137]|uniref:phytoene desaturase family protein n=1 Tax=Tabrizicola sp. TH137 TaxID=2067452 RepID=UPI000C7E8033|nr:NAD(P)/FAD-dependent oxidoreductase [Tabrizicola sp. TH137]PLL10591.1 phytoene dehydrogenase [Tabrizicola sp. TH137]
MPSFDTIVIGAGPNGLAAAHRLAKGGASVLVLEAGAAPGGGAAALAHLSYNLDPRVEQGMDLARHGLTWATTALPTTALAADGNHLRMDGVLGARLSGNIDPADAKAWADLRARLLRFAAILAPLNTMTPPRPAADAKNPLLKLAMIGLKARMMGAAEFRELGRIFLTNVFDLLDDELRSPLLKGALAFDATLGSWLGPRSPNSVLPWLYRLSGATQGQQGALGLPEGGMPALATAMAKAAVAAGVTIRCNARVARIEVTDGTATGVTLTSGEEITAKRIVSALAPKTTLTALIGPRHLDNGLYTRARHQKARGGAARLDLTLSSLPDFRGADPTHRLLIAPSDQHVERAFNPVKYGEVPEEPVMELLIPTARTPAPDGQHRLSAIVQYAPHAPADRDAARAAMLAACLLQLERHAPGLTASVTETRLRMPYDIEAETGLPGGNWHAGELSVEQMLFLRPLPGIAQYRTPITGLWLASAGCHPGGGVSGTPGWNAALAMEAER